MSEPKERQKIVRFDWAMKHLLRNKANFDIIEGFLAALLNDNALTVLEIIESESNVDHRDEKFNRVDVMIKDGYGRKIIIEIQNTRESDYLERILFGTAKAITESIGAGKDFKYKDVAKIISISILYFNLGIGKDYLYHGETTFKGLNDEKEIEKVKAVLPDSKRYQGLAKFPEYYLIQVEKYKNILSHAIDEWIYWFKNEEVEESSSSKNIDKVKEKLAYLKMLPDEQKAYQEYLSRLASEADMIETAKNDGRKEAEKEIQQAKAQAEQERKDKEAAEAKAEQERKDKEVAEAKAEQERKDKEAAENREKEANIKLAKKMLKYNESIEEIMTETKLRREEIEDLKA